jgi:AraC-like DNA-binding protein
VGRLELRTLYVRPDRAVSLPERCRVVAVPPLLRELIQHAIELGPLIRSRPGHGPVIDLVLDRVRALEDQPLELPWPRDPRALRLARRLAADAADDASLASLAAGSGAGRRTQERLFRRETGMSVGQWRQQHRMLTALELLASGRSVTAVALDVGYRSTSAFVAAFRASLGATPGRFVAGRAPRALSASSGRPRSPRR